MNRNSRLPDLREKASVYLQNPGGSSMYKSKSNQSGASRFKSNQSATARSICGLCGVIHKPGEPHSVKRISEPKYPKPKKLAPLNDSRNLQTTINQADSSFYKNNQNIGQLLNSVG